MSRRLALALLVFDVVGLTALNLNAAERARSPTATDRRFVVLSLQELSDHVGFGATFALGATDDVLVMTGSDLCGPDMLETLPPKWHRDIVEAGFKSFECSGGGVTARVKVRS